MSAIDTATSDATAPRVRTPDTRTQEAAATDTRTPGSASEAPAGRALQGASRVPAPEDLASAPAAGSVGPAGPGDTQGPSARSLLLTVLGEFVHPREGSIWTGTLVDALGVLGVEPKSARQALSRTAAEGLLVSSRHGRRVRWRLSPAGCQLLQEGTERIHGFMRDPHPWDGRWLVVTVTIPESQRRLRQRLRTRLTWLGLGSPSAGMWVVPDAGKEGEVRAVLAELDLLDRAFAWTGHAAGFADHRRILASAWRLGDVEERYLRFIDRFRDVQPHSDADFFVCQVDLVQEWRRFPFVDPELPRELLDHDWPGPRAAATFHDLRLRWHRRAQAEWDRMDVEAGRRA